MKRNWIYLILGVAWLLALTPAWAQTDLNGAWKIVEGSGHDVQGEFTQDQPSLFIFQDGYYSFMWVRGAEARPLMADDDTRMNINEQRMRAIFMPFVANSGTYEVQGSKLIVKPMVALWPNFMEGGSATYEYSLGKDVLSLSRETETVHHKFKLQRLH